MKQFINFFTENSEQIWTLISVIIGGLVTYISTSAAEARNSKIQSKKDNLDHVLIPYCTCLEETISYINSSKNFVSSDSFDKWINILYNPIKYLDAGKRVFLSQSMRKKLENYKSDIENFIITLDREVSTCFSEYKNYIISILEQYKNVPNFDSVTLSFNITNEDIYAKIKSAIINKGLFFLLDNIDTVYFLNSDNPDTSQYSIHISTEIRDQWDSFKCLGQVPSNDDPEDAITFDLLNYLDSFLSNYPSTMHPVIDKTVSSSILTNITNELNCMHKELVKTIDKITK